MNHHDYLLEEVTKLRDFNINCVQNKELADYYSKWVSQVSNEIVKDNKLREFIKNQLVYWRKDKNYCEYLIKLLKIGIKYEVSEFLSNIGILNEFSVKPFGILKINRDSMCNFSECNGLYEEDCYKYIILKIEEALNFKVFFSGKTDDDLSIDLIL